VKTESEMLDMIMEQIRAAKAYVDIQVLAIPTGDRNSAYTDVSIFLHIALSDLEKIRRNT
jgi:hypothetical protein